MEIRSEVPSEVSPFLVESKNAGNTEKQSSVGKSLLKAVAILGSIAALAGFVHYNHHSHGSTTEGNSGVFSLNNDDDGNSEGYSELMGNRTWRLSGMNNCEKKDIEDGTCDNCNDINGVANITVLKDRDANLQMMCAFDTKYNQIFFIYRGSEASNYKDYNLDFKLVDYEGDDDYCSEDENSKYCCGDDCKVHSGFQRAFQDLQAISWDTIKQYISDFSDYPIMLSGYSLGGGIGHFAAMQLTRYLDEIGSSQPLHFYSHGSVRIGNEDMVEYYERILGENGADYWRVTWLHDPIPKLPPYEFGYRHSGNEVWYYCWEDDMSYKICEDGDDSSCSDGYRQGNPVENLADHVYYYKYFNSCPKEWYKKYPVPTICEDIDE